MRYVTTIVVALILLVACGGSANAKRRSNPYGIEVRMDNGRRVPCVVAETTKGVGISCDWNAR